jgi:Putative esterase
MHRLAFVTVLCLLLVGCGGGSGGGTAVEGSRQYQSIVSRGTGTIYPLSLYLPPASAGPKDRLPVVYVLDGESWFETLVGIVEANRMPVIIVAITSAGQRSRDFVPANSCTPNGGGHVDYLAFMRQELIPFVEATVGGDPTRRILFGHSHGGSFALFSMFSEPPGKHTFKTYVASDSSLGCMPAEVSAWEEGFAAASRQLPVRLHLSYASQGNYQVNLNYAAVIAQRSYSGFEFVAKAYEGSHSGIVPQVLGEAMGLALRP